MGFFFLGFLAFLTLDCRMLYPVLYGLNFYAFFFHGSLFHIAFGKL